MFVDHVPPPIVLSGKALAPCPRVRARLFEAVELARLLMFVVDVAVEMCLGPEALVAVRMWTLVRTFVVSSVMAIDSVSGCKRPHVGQRRGI